MINRKKEIVRYVFPTLLSNLCVFLFTIVDGIFVGNGVGSNALGSINIAYPFIMLVNTLFVIISVGGSAIFAVSIGRGEKEKANTIFRTSFVLILLVSILVTIITLLFNEKISLLIGATETFIDDVKDYIFYCALFFVPQSLSFLLQNFCRNDDSPTLVSVAVITSTMCNIAGDWLFIFPLQMGIKGAAIATGISQTIGLIVMLIHFFKKNRVISFGIVKLKKSNILDILYRGLPSGVGQLEGPVMTITANIMLSRLLGDVAVTSFSVISYVTTFAIAVCFGVSDGLQPLFGRSYGEGDNTSLKYYFKSGVVISLAGSIVTTILVIVLRSPICVLFGLSGNILSYCVKTLPKVAISFVFFSVSIIITSYFYSTEKSKEATIVNLFRGVLLPILFIVFIPLLFGNESIWYAFVLYEFLSLIISLIIFIKTSSKTLTLKSGDKV